mmetsp:Transcript_5678/g.22404  ORF Transcript_5678/g.22404 Transcript_5678/m.22404 type:complete len:427 (-) Transcript_5678:2087-3367(-)
MARDARERNASSHGVSREHHPTLALPPLCGGVGVGDTLDEFGHGIGNCLNRAEFLDWCCGGARIGSTGLSGGTVPGQIDRDDARDRRQRCRDHLPVPSIAQKAVQKHHERRGLRFSPTRARLPVVMRDQSVGARAPRNWHLPAHSVLVRHWSERSTSTGQRSHVGFARCGCDMHTLTSATDRTLERRRIRIPQVRLVEERASTEAMRCDAFRVDVVWLGRVRGACERGDGRHSGAALKCRRVHSACTSGRTTTRSCGSAFNAPDDRRFEHERSGATRGHQCGDCIGHATRVLRPTDCHTRALIECQRRLLRARRVRGPLSRTNRRNTIERHGAHHVILARVGSAVLKERTHERLPREGLLDVLKSALAESVHERRILLRRPPLIGVHAHGTRPPRGAKKRLRSADRRSRSLAIPASISGAHPTPYL